MSSSKFASFAPYAPPPDEAELGSNFQSRPWFPSHSVSESGTSYQSGGIPTFNAAMAGGPSHLEVPESQVNQWETRYSMRLEILAAVAYLLGPASALALLILETQNDYVRFHAYQSALVSTPLVIIRILASLLQLPSPMRTFFTFTLLFLFSYMAFRAYQGAKDVSLTRYRLPFVGSLAEQWLAEE